MHPQINLPKPGQCPICFMDLIPLEEESGGDESPRRLTMSARAAALADIQTSPVERKYATARVRMVGKIVADETRMADITAWVGGRLDRLFVDYTGTTVRKGDHLVSLYSPDLIVAQTEYLRSIESAERASRLDPKLAESQLQSAEEKLRLMGLLPRQIEEIRERGTPSDHLTVYSPIGGIVMEKHANEGAYVATGTRIYTVAELSVVWVYLHAYESDLPWLRYGQRVEFTTESRPGEVFEGRIAFIDPVLDEKTRTVRVRVNVANADGTLKPGMFVRAVVQGRLDASGDIFDPLLAGKWICPMHPEIVKEASDDCGICGMELVPAAELGYSVAAETAGPALVIPATAPLITGKRAVVYVAVPDTDRPAFEGREVILGPRAGDEYVVRRGLNEGERVVTNGNFKLDSALQIRAKPSMMNPPEEKDRLAEGAEPLDVPAAFRAELNPIYEAYLEAHTALADDRPAEASAAFAGMKQVLDAFQAGDISAKTRNGWREIREALATALRDLDGETDIEMIRTRFEPLSEGILELAGRFGHARKDALHRAFCPMAFENRGAAWLQSGETISNPYFGHAMLRCGEIQETFAPAGAVDSDDESEGGDGG